MAITTISNHRLPPLRLFAQSEQALRLGLSDIQLLRFKFYDLIIEQKELLFINRMNLYFRDISNGRVGDRKNQKLRV